MKITPTDALPDIFLIEPRVFEDPRGFFFEAWRLDACAAAGIPTFVQDNQSRSVEGTLRGLHYQLDRPQGKLVRVLSGEIFDVAVDIRRGSPTFGRWAAVTLSARLPQALWIPPGFAHGFCVTEGPADVLYKCTDYYSGAADQRGVAWNDPGIGITWPMSAPLLSEKDTQYGPLDDTRTDLPAYLAAR